MGKLLDGLCHILGQKTYDEKIQEFKKVRNKYLNEALEEYECNGKTLEDYVSERAKIDLNPNDNVQKYKSDLKRWFLRTKEAFNKIVPHDYAPIANSTGGKLWLEKMAMKDSDFPLIFYIKDSEDMIADIGYIDEAKGLFYHKNRDELAHWLTRYPRPNKYRKHRVTIVHEYKEKEKPKKKNTRPRRKKRNAE